MTERAPRVAVVGGGIAGITAALALADGGATVSLLESRSRLGGLARSFRRGELTIDNGQHVFVRCCTEYRGLLERIGASDLVRLQPRLDLTVLRPGHVAGVLRRDRMPAPLHLARSLARYRHLSRRERVAAMQAAWAMRHLDPLDPALDARVFDDWLTEHGQDRIAIDRLWNVISKATLNADPEDISLALAAMVFKAGLLDAGDAADIGFADVPLGTLHDAAASTALAAAGVQLRRNAKVTRVEPVGGPRPSVRLGLQAGDAAEDFVAVILAVPHQVVTTLVPELSTWSGLRPSPIINVHVIYDRPVTDLPFAAAVDSPVQWVFDRTEQAGVQTGQYLAVSVSAAGSQIGVRTDVLVPRYVRALAELFPVARHAEVLDAFVTREPNATFLPAPGTGAMRPGARTAISGLFLAGAWTDTGWPATMEGAARSGRVAAAAVLEDHERSGDVEVAAMQDG